MKIANTIIDILPMDPSQEYPVWDDTLTESENKKAISEYEEWLAEVKVSSLCCYFTRMQLLDNPVLARPEGMQQAFKSSWTTEKEALSEVADWLSQAIQSIFTATSAEIKETR